jgi:hypothetical protein
MQIADNDKHGNILVARLAKRAELWGAWNQASKLIGSGGKRSAAIRRKNRQSLSSLPQAAGLLAAF